jgi:Fe-S-cluster containining protein
MAPRQNANAKTDAKPMFQIRLKLFGRPVEASAPVPPGPARLDELLPFFRRLDDAVVDAAVAHVTAEGRTVSCRRGCSACCRAQPVPILPAEAYALLRLVESLPEPRQSQVRAAFADRVARLEASGEAGIWRSQFRDVPLDEARAAAQRYFRLGLVCPFLSDEGACGIYEHRPLVCRQYLVTSPAENCRDAFEHSIERVPFPLKPIEAGLTAADGLLGRPQVTIPLVLALEYAAAHRAELERTFEPTDVFRRWMTALTGAAAAKG